MTKVLHVGFSGTREGMNEFQKKHLAHWLREFMLKSKLHEDLWLHHGDCVGADVEAHITAREYGYYIYKHPPIDGKLSANMPSDREDPPYSYSGRNQRIVLATHVLIATPKKDSGGGTWNTIQHAINNNRPRVIIHRNRVETFLIDNVSKV